MSANVEFHGAVLAQFLAQEAQGVITYSIADQATGPVYAPVPGDVTTYTLQAVCSGVAQKYVDGTRILATDKMVTASVFSAEPELDGHMTVDGERLSIVQIFRIPAAGTVIAWKIVCRS